jgi:hypothetical protein
MHHHNSRWIVAALLCLFAALCVHAQTEGNVDAAKRLFPQVGSGVFSVKHGPAGYYVLVSRNVLVFDPSGKVILQIPPAGSKSAAPALVYGVAMDVDSSGLIYVADRGANALRVFSPAGARVLDIPFNAPTGIAALPGGEIAATSASGPHLITVFDAHGKERRSFGEVVEILDDSSQASINRFMNTGHLTTDAAKNLYYSFDYLPEPTFRKFDRSGGFVMFEFTLDTIDVAPQSQALRRELKREIDKGSVPELQQRISCFAVDPETNRIWMGLGDMIELLEPDGRQLAEYRVHTPDGGRLTPNSLLIEPTRLIITADPLGVFEFARPDKTSPVSTTTGN